LISEESIFFSLLYKVDLVLNSSSLPLYSQFSLDLQSLFISLYGGCFSHITFSSYF
jgi:hypothetical protein